MSRLRLSDAYKVMSAGVPEPVVDRVTGEQRHDRDGRLLSGVPVVLFAVDGGAEVVTVRCADIGEGVDQGAALRVTGLAVTPWQMGDRSGLTFSAERIERLGRERRDVAGGTSDTAS